MKEFFDTYPLAAWSVVSVLMAAVVIMTLWEQVKWWWFNCAYWLNVGKTSHQSHTFISLFNG